MKYRSSTATEAVDGGPDRPAGDSAHLAKANVNPTTGLASDYLNHFIEAVMLLEMMSGAPEFRDEFLRWQPVSYREHFTSSRFNGRDTAIVAYERADPDARARLEALSSTMAAILESARVALCADPSPANIGKIAGEAVAVLNPLLARAGAVINGSTHIDGAEASQASIDDLLKG